MREAHKAKTSNKQKPRTSKSPEQAKAPNIFRFSGLSALLSNQPDADPTYMRVVPRRGLEPPHLAAHGPEPCASTNSATWALKDTVRTMCYAAALVALFLLRAVRCFQRTDLTKTCVPSAVGFTMDLSTPLTISASVFSLGRTTEAAHYIRKFQLWQNDRITNRKTTDQHPCPKRRRTSIPMSRPVKPF